MNADALRKIITPGQVFEIRALDVQGNYGAPYTASGYFNDVDKAAAAVASLPTCKGVYYTPSPVKPELLSRRENRIARCGKGDATTGNHEIEHRAWLLIDIDPDRPAGICATDAEKEIARQVARRIYKELKAEGWPAPVVCDSGNGMQAMFRVDLPADDGGLCERVTKAIVARFDAEGAHVDQAVHNAARIWRLPGTLNRKGDNTETRPHRTAEILDVPEPLEVVPLAMLGAMAATIAPEQVQAVCNTTRPASKPTGKGWTFETWREFILSNFANCQPGEPEPYRGGWRIKFKLCPFDSSHTESAVATFNTTTGAGYTCLHNSCKGHHWQALRALVEPVRKPRESNTDAATDGKPRVYLPDGATTITDAAAKLGALLAERLDIFNRGGAIVQLTADAEGKPQLMDVKPAALASTFETVANLRKETSKGDFPACCCEAMARLIMHAEAFRDALPRLSMLAACPVLTEHDGALVEVHGYDPQTGIYASGDKPETVELAEAVDLLSDVLEGFRFATPADGSRARAALITPALIFGKLLPGRAPIDLGEADNSQSGKGYRDKLKTAVYGQAAKTITQKSAGVGGLEESFSNALIRGCSFIQFDNVKGKIDSPAVESFLTEDHFTARAPYREPVDIDPRCVCVGMTSNKADLTKDLANRCSAVRILKQPDGHHFKSYPEGDVLDHIRANQPRYLGAVFAVVKAWHAAGKPRTHETRHDFRGWAQTLDWIVQNIFNAPPLMEGHRETQTRMTNPALGWLRDVAIEVLRANQGGTWLRAFDLLDLLSETEIEMPGTPEHGDLDEPETRKKALQAIGRKMGICFRAGEVMAIDGMTISRREGFEIEKARTVREYCFEAPPMDGTDNRGNGAAHRGKDASLIPERDESNTESTVSPIAPPMDSPMDSPIKTLVSPNSPIGSKHIKGDENMTLNNSNKSSKGAIGGIGGKRDASDVPEGAPAAPAADLFTPHETPAAKVWSVAL